MNSLYENQLQQAGAHGCLWNRFGIGSLFIQHSKKMTKSYFQMELNAALIKFESQASSNRISFELVTVEISIEQAFHFE